MNELIYKQHAIEKLTEVCDEAENLLWEWEGCAGYCDLVRSIKTCLDDLQSEIIRCKDCKYYDKTLTVHARCGCTIQGKIFGMVRCEDDDFCSYGERK